MNAVCTHVFVFVLHQRLCYSSVDMLVVSAVVAVLVLALVAVHAAFVPGGCFMNHPWSMILLVR